MNNEQEKTSADSKKPYISKSLFGETPEGTANLFTLSNNNGMQVRLTNYGGIIVSIIVPDKDGNLEDVVLGFDSLDTYLNNNEPYFGAIIGRYGNRIAEGKFTLDGRQYNLAQNNGNHHLHGGIKGFDKVLWEAAEIKANDHVGVLLSYLSKDMEEGYPGNLQVKVRYLLNSENELTILYEAATDMPTLCNLTNHTYFNLAGEGIGDVLNHQLRIAADWITPVDEGLIPTGSMMPVKGTAFDFRIPKPIGEDIESMEKQMQLGGGYDHNFALGQKDSNRPLAATVYEPASGRFMEVFTEEPGIQLYTGNFLDGKHIGKRGVPYRERSGFCLETQHYPDTPNQPKFPSVILSPDEIYKTSTVYKFSVR